MRMASRVYLNDHLIEPAFDEALLDDDPWGPADFTAEVQVMQVR